MMSQNLSKPKVLPEDYMAASALVDAYLLEAFGMRINIPYRTELERFIARGFATQRETLARKVDALDTHWVEGLQSRSAVAMRDYFADLVRNKTEYTP